MLLHGDCRTVLPDLVARGLSVRTCVTSPPYYGHRDYGVGPDALGLEETPEDYVANLVTVMRQVWDVLTRDGTLWLVLGDSYSGSGINDGTKSPGLSQPAQREQSSKRPDGKRWNCPRKPKDLIGIPFLVAFALQQDGWWLRSIIPWIKRNPMPESCRDRPTVAVEYVLLLAKSRHPYFNQDAIRRPDRGTDHPRNVVTGQPSLDPSGGVQSPHRGLRTPRGRNDLGRAPRNSDWFFDSWQGLLWDEHAGPIACIVNPTPCPEQHHAAFPPKLVEPCVLAGSDVGDTILDPFCGSGTTLVVAQSLRRRFIGIDTNAAYIEMAERRTSQCTLWETEPAGGDPKPNRRG